MIVRRNPFAGWPTFQQTTIQYFEYLGETGRGEIKYENPRDVKCKISTVDTFVANSDGAGKVQLDYKIFITSGYNRKTLKYELPITQVRSKILYNNQELTIISIDSVNNADESPANAIINCARKGIN